LFYVEQFYASADDALADAPAKSTSPSNPVSIYSSAAQESAEEPHF